MAIVQMVKIAHHIKDGVEAVGDKVHVAIEGAFNMLAAPSLNAYTIRWQGSQSDANGYFVDALQAPSRSRLGNLPLLPWSRRMPAFSRASSPPVGSVESLLKASSFPSTAIAPPLSVAAAARRPTHRMRHSVDAPVLALKDANALFRRDSSPDTPSLDLGPSPGRVALRRDSVRCGQRSTTYVPRRRSPDDGGVGGDDHSLVPIPFPRVVSGAPSSSPLNTPSLSQSPSFDSVERATSNKRGRFQSEVDSASSRRWPRPNSYDEFGAKPRRSRFESMVNLGVASGEQASASDLMVRDVTEGSVSRQTLVVREEGRHQRTFDDVQCDLKAANILTTKTGNVKLSDSGVSPNLRAIEREIKDVTGTPNWMALEVIELKGASPKSDIWSLGCTDIELLTGRPPYGDIGNAMTVMFRIVEDESPPTPERFFSPLVAFLKECFHEGSSMQQSAEQLFEHEDRIAYHSFGG
ncbi:hypothetical protein EDB85DRAFT_2293167 [Lactarius pseudohatsudake]|nr:hypothetical protein EDB85DRAFT_2293167 [Lactarius pseudohatsudake]